MVWLAVLPAAARARRLSEEAEIVLFERGPYVSFANCGLPYFVGDIIKDEADLLVASAELFRERFNIEVRTENEVTIRDLRNGTVYREKYDALVLAPGATPIKPNLPGIDLPGIQIDVRGGITIDEQMLTSDPHIWAVGDVVSVPDYIRGEDIHIPLAGPANRQGRVAADAILGRDTTFRGVQCTSV